MRVTLRRGVVLAAVTLLLAGGCGKSEKEPDTPTRRTILPPTFGPYVTVAVDNHFHDVHPEDDVQISGDRSLVIKNQGSNTHNVTLPEADIDVNIKPGEQYSIGPPLTDLLEVGQTYIFFCQFHPEARMLGQFTVTAPAD